MTDEQRRGLKRVMRVCRWMLYGFALFIGLWLVAGLIAEVFG